MSLIPGEFHHNSEGGASSGWTSGSCSFHFLSVYLSSSTASPWNLSLLAQP